jgi:light-harvesting complex 1 beta chain
MAYSHLPTHHETPRSSLADFKYFFVVLFFVFLALAIVGQMFFLNWRTWLPGAEGSQSMFGSVKSAVYTVISQLS